MTKVPAGGLESRREGSVEQRRQGRTRDGGWWLAGASHSWLLPQPTPLYITPGHLLDKFIKDFLQPNQTFQDQIKKALKIICSFLEENCFQHSTTKIQVIQVSPGLFLCSWRGIKQSLDLGKSCDHRKCAAKDAGGKLGRAVPGIPVLGGGEGGAEALLKSLVIGPGAGHAVCLAGFFFF